MEESHRADATRSLWTLILAALFGIGFFFQQPTSKSPRPLEKRIETTAPDSGQNVPARLWQDPLEVALDDWARHAKEATFAESAEHRQHGSRYAASQHAPSRIWQAVEAAKPKAGVWFDAKSTEGESRKAERKAGIRFEVLPVFLPGDAYASETETRLQLRYAVPSALAPSDTVPSLREGECLSRRDTCCSPYSWRCLHSHSSCPLPKPSARGPWTICTHFRGIGGTWPRRSPSRA